MNGKTAIGFVIAMILLLGALFVLNYFGASVAEAATTRTLSRGMSGNDVRAAQLSLVVLKYLVASDATGYFGPKTESAVKAFQKQYNIVSAGTPSSTGYGAIGPRTNTILLSIVRSMTQTAAVQANARTQAPSSQASQSVQSSPSTAATPTAASQPNGNYSTGVSASTGGSSGATTNVFDAWWSGSYSWQEPEPTYSTVSTQTQSSSQTQTQAQTQAQQTTGLQTPAVNTSAATQSSNSAGSQNHPLPAAGTAVWPVYGTFGSLGCRSDFQTQHINHLMSGPGTYTVQATPEAAARIINNSGQALQVDSIQPTDQFPGVWGEYSVYVDFMAAHESYYGDGILDPYQPWAGVGESGSVPKPASSSAFPPISWADNSATGLALPSGSCLVLNGYAGSNTVRQFQVTVSPQQVGVVSIRQPKVDHVIRCSGAMQNSDWQPWTNTTGGAISITGATVYASYGSEAAPAAGACVYVLNTNAQIRRSICSNTAEGMGLNARGVVSFNDTLQPNESIVYQAQNTCIADGGVWGVAAFIHARK